MHGGNFIITRYTTSGALDRHFGHGGQVETDLGGADAAYSIAIVPDGSIVVAGTSGKSFAFAGTGPTVLSISPSEVAESRSLR